MPDMTLEEALKEAYAAAPNNLIVYDTLEFRHPEWITPIRVVRDFVNLVARLEADAPLNPGEDVTFTGFAFDMARPDVDPNSSPEVSITIDNVSLEIEDALLQTVTSVYPIEVTYRPYLSSNLTMPAMNPPMTLVLQQVQASSSKITAVARLGDFANKKFPSEEYTSRRFPGLVR